MKSGFVSEVIPPLCLLPDTRERRRAGRVRELDHNQTEYTYDANGNVTSSFVKEIEDITYDPFTNKTMSMSSSGVGADYQYDGRGERILKTETVQSVTTTLYLRGLGEYPTVEKYRTGKERVYIYGPTGLIAVQDSERFQLLADWHATNWINQLHSV